MLVRIGEVAKIIERTPLTIKHWYEWEETYGVNETLGKLPYMYRLGVKGVRHFESVDIPKLIQFRDNLRMNPGIMREFNRKFKGEQGKLQQERAEFKEMLNNFK